MKDYKQYLRSKSKPIKGSATLEPPAGGQDALQSVASMAVLDLISEGPIYGLVDGSGRKANNISILESLNLEGTPVLGKNVASPQIRSIDFDQIQMMGRLTSGNIETAFDNISGELVAHEQANISNAPMSKFKKDEIGQDKQALLEFLDENKSLSRFGMVQFKLSGIYPHTDNIYSRVNTTTNIFDNDPPDDPTTVNNFVIEWGDVTNTYTGIGTGTITMLNDAQGNPTTTPNLRNGSLQWTIASNQGSFSLSKQDTNGDGVFYWRFGGLYSYAKYSTNGNDINLAIPGATSTSEDFPWTDRVSSTWYDYNSHTPGTSTEWLEFTVKFRKFNTTSVDIYNATTFDLDVYHETDKAKRSIQSEDGRVVEIPSPFVYGYQSFNNALFGNYAASPSAVDVNQAGKVGKQYLIDGFAGGGIFFFEIGDNDEIGAGGGFNTGKFFVQKNDPSMEDAIQSGADNGYDVFVYENSTGPISLEAPSPNQLSPIVGEIAGQEIGLGYTSDLDLQYNYGNIDFDFRDGFETQPKMEGHSQGAQDFDIRKKLYGPLSYDGSASAGDGEGYSDSRAGGDFSDWMLNPPLESDSYPYTHTIRRIDVKRCVPTIAIEALTDVVDDGNDAGVQRSETLLISYMYGFEGGVTGSVGALLSGGNSLQDIALGTFLNEDQVRYRGIVVSNYLDTYSGIGDLPKNKSLKNLKVDDTSIPGLTTALISEFGYTWGDYLFPGDDWKIPNRFLKVEKLSYETDSTLIERECSLSYVSEIVDEPFSYPLVALGGTIFDARNFATQPSREFDIRGKLVAIPSNYEPLNADGSDKRFIDSSAQYGLREIQTFDGSTHAQVHDDINLGASNFEIEARVGFGTVSTTSSDYQYIVDVGGGASQANRVAIFQNNNKINAIIKESSSTNTDFILDVDISGRNNNNHKYADREYINDVQNLTYSAGIINIDTSTSFNIQFDLVLGNVSNTSPGSSILWTHGSWQRLEIGFTTGNRIELALVRLKEGEADGDGNIAATEVPAKSATSTRTFSQFELVEFKLEGNLSTGIKLRDRSDNSIIVELTTAVLADVASHTNGMVRIGTLYILGVNSQNSTPSRGGAGAMTNLSVQGTSVFTDTYNVPGVIKRFNSDPNFITLGQANPADVYDISLKGIGQKYTLEVKVGDEVVGTDTDTMSTPRGNVDFESLLIGINANQAASTKLKAKTTLSDLKIRKNNQLIHHWDGTIINTTRQGFSIKDKVGGFHADIVGTASGVSDDLFVYGKNKKRIYNGPWDGTFKLGWTDNPAWILYDLMINPIYGVGNSIDDREDVNIFNLYRIAQYCDAVDEDGYFDGLPDATRGLEPRFSCNLRIHEAKNAFEVIGNMASVFRGFTYWDGVGLNFAVDKEKEISAIFNNGNVHDGLFNYGDVVNSARFTKIEVLYADAKDQYGQKAEYIEDEEGIRKYGVITKILNGIGCTSKSQAKRMGKYVLLSNKMETEIAKFKASSECHFLEPGDIIRIDDELKNFEINYGKILDVYSAGNNPYVLIENNVNPSSIQIGANGGIYLYTARRQNELENIYDIVKYKSVYQFGEDSDVYSGVVNSDYIDQMNLNQIQKIEVTGVQPQENAIKLYLDTGSENIEYLTGVKAGSFFNIELNNNVEQTYKIVKKTQAENNLFDIEAMEYDIQKFQKIEQEDFDDEEITYNIGIPANIINRPSQPSFETDPELTVFQRSDLSYSVTGNIIPGSPNDSETSYRVIAYRSQQAGPYIQKEFLRESDGTTYYELNGLIDGDYTIKVAALRNPESSNNSSYNFVIDAKKDVYMKPIIRQIEIGHSSSSNYERISGSGFGSGASNYQDVEYRFVTVDKKDRVFSLTQLDYTLDIFVEKSGEYILVDEDYENDVFTFDDVDNANIFGSYNPEFNMKFDLKKDGTIVDSAFFETSVN